MGQKYIIVGGGVAAVTAAKEIRDNDASGEIFIFTEEGYQPYNRMKLSKEFYSDLYAEKNHIKKDKWFEKFGITVVQNARIDQVDTAAQTVVTTSGETIAYDKLLLCTGSKNRALPVPGADKTGVFAIRKLADAENLKAYIADKKQVALIGGGVQNLELADSLRKEGKEVTVIEAAPRLMGRQLDTYSSDAVLKTMAEAGVEVITGASVEAVLGADAVSGVQLSDRTIACDALIYSVGIVPNIEFLKTSEIALGRGILVDEKMATNVQAVYAAGDAAELNGEVVGLWGSAMEQGRVAGHNMSSAEALDYQKVTPATLFQAFGLGLMSIGDIDENNADEVYSVSDGSYVKLFIKNKQITGVISFEGVMKMMSYKQAVDSEQLVDTKSADVRLIMASL